MAAQQKGLLVLFSYTLWFEAYQRTVGFDLLVIVTPIVGVCNCSMSCCTLLYDHSSSAIILMRKRELVALFSSRDCCVALPRDDMGLSAVCDCGISRSYSLFWGYLSGLHGFVVFRWTV